MNAPRVLHVVPHLERVGGYELQARRLVARQRRAGLATTILTHAAPGQPRDEVDAVLGPIHRLPRGRRRHHPGAWWRAHGDAFDLVHAHAMHTLSGQIAARARGAGIACVVKVATEGDVAAFAAPRDPSFARRARRRIAFARMARADAFVAMTPRLADELAAFGIAATLLPNGVDVEAFAPPAPSDRSHARTALGLPREAPVVAVVCRLEARKRVDVVIDALARRAGAILLVAGDGPLRATWEARAHRAGVAARWLGMRDDVRTVLHAADVFALASEREGRPNALLEAWACGLPAVVSAIPAHEAPAGVARHVPPGDVAAWHEELDALLDDAGARAALGAAARRHVERTASLSAVTALWLALYDALRERAPRRA